MVGWLDPGGVAIFTLHGRWSICRQADTPYKYIDDEAFTAIAARPWASRTAQGEPILGRREIYGRSLAVS